jgi:sugar phosphate isomerase/epimerase
MKLGLYNAIFHDRSLPDAIQVVADVGLTGLEINSGGFLPAAHVPAFDDILVSDSARDDFLGVFEGTGVSIAGLSANGNPLHPNRTIGEKQAEDIRRSIRLAERLGQHRLVHYVGPSRRRARSDPPELGRRCLELRSLGRARLPAGDCRRLLARNRPRDRRGRGAEGGRCPVAGVAGVMIA